MSTEQLRLGGRLLASGILVLVLGADAGPKKAPVPSTRTGKAEVHAAFSRPLKSFHVQATCLEDVLKLLSKKAGVKILADWREPDLDASKGFPVTLHVRGLSAKDILSLILSVPQGADFVVEPGAVRIVPDAIGEVPGVKRAYDVRDVLPLLPKGGWALEKFIAAYVRTGESGFYGSLRLDREKGRLHAKGSVLALKRLGRLLHLLRHPIIPTRKGVTKDAVLVGEAKVLAALKRKCNKALAGPKTLGNAIDLLRKEGGFNIYMMLWEPVRVDFRKVVVESLQTRGVTYGEILKSMMKAANEKLRHTSFNYVLRGPVIVIDVDKVLRTCEFIVRAYDVEDILRRKSGPASGRGRGPTTTRGARARPRTAAELVARIRRLVKPFDKGVEGPSDRWSVAEIQMRVLNNKLLLVRHNWYAHRKIVEYLMSLEGARAGKDP